MKMRSGFVSNSSTSNYIVIGVKVHEELLKRLVKQFNIDPELEISDAGWEVAEYLESDQLIQYYHVDGEEDIIGKPIGNFDDDYLETASLDFREIDKIVREIAGRLGVDPDDIGLHMGCRPS